MTLSEMKNISTRETNRGRTYTEKLFENMNASFGLPVEPQDAPWNRIDSDKESLVLKFEFSNRENSKDFVAAVQELEDRMQVFCKILIQRNEIKISYDLPETGSVSERAREFLSAVKSIEESIGER